MCKLNMGMLFLRTEPSELFMTNEGVLGAGFY
jgi:hypothetical protein